MKIDVIGEKRGKVTNLYKKLKHLFEKKNKKYNTI